MDKNNELEQARIDYWVSLGWQFSQNLGLWNAEKQFEGIEETFVISGIETFENLDSLLNDAEFEYAKTIENANKNLAIFRGEETVNLNGENIVDGDFVDAPETAKNSPPRVMENLKVELDKEQIEAKTSELLQTMNTLESVESRFESLKKSHKSETNSLEDQIKHLRNVIDSKAEWLDVECEQRFDYARGIVDVYRIDTGAYLKSRQMKESERQAKLFV